MMEHEQVYKEIARKRALIYLLCVALLFVSLVLASCSPQPISYSAPTAVPVAQSPLTNGPVSTTGEIRSATATPNTSSSTEIAPNQVSPTPSHESKADSPAVRSYHAVLLLERAADLLLAVVEKVQAGQISQDDTSAIAPYTNAFPVAIDAFNQSTPPMELEDAWNQVFAAAQQYNQARTMLIWRMPISSQNLADLTSTRKLLAIDQEMVEVYLAQSGLGPDFLVAEQQAVDQHLQLAYGDQRVPTLSRGASSLP